MSVYFSLRHLTHAYLCDGFKIVAYTDVPCHLWLRWSNNTPQIHDKPVERRGLVMHGDRYFCFTAYTDNEQEEYGDTIRHTFIKRNWAVCECRWFYFYGRIGYEWCRSTTPLFFLHFNIIHQIYLDSASNRTCQANHIDWQPCHDAPSAPIMDNYKAPWYLLFAGVEHVATHWCYRSFLFFNTTGLDPSINYEEGYLSISVYETKMSASEAYPYLQITEGVQSDPVIPSNYGAQLPYTDVGGQIRYDELIPGQYNNILLNHTGIGFINAGGITKLCLRAQLDVEDHDVPAGTNWVKYYSHQKGDAFKPKLTLCLPP